MKKRLIVVMLMAGLFLAASPALWGAGKWYTEIGIGGHNLSLAGPNGLIKSFNDWLGDTCGITGFEAEEIPESTTLYSLSTGVEFPNGLKVGVNLGYRAGKESYREKLMTVGVEGTEKLVRVKTYSFNGGVSGDLSLYYRFVSSKSGLVPYIGTGLGWYATVLFGEYLVEEYTPALNRSFSGSFSASGLALGHVIMIGIESSGEKSRVRLEAKYHQVGSVEGKFGHLENNGFATSPFKPGPFNVNTSGWTIGGGIIFNL